MSNFIKNLKELLRTAVAELYSGKPAYDEITESGFFCDFDLRSPINPEKITAIDDWLSEKEIQCAYELSGFSGAYLDGDSSKRMLQRIHVNGLAEHIKDDIEQGKPKYIMQSAACSSDFAWSLPSTKPNDIAIFLTCLSSFDLHGT